jgi:hypothetical protein
VTRWLWTAANGTVTDLSAWSQGTYVVGDGTSGHLAPTYGFVTDEISGVDGEQLQQVTAQGAAPVLAMDFVASDGVELRQRLRNLAHVLRPRAGLGRLTAVADDGSARSLPCYYRKGLESGTYRVTRYRAALEFWSPSPWWRGESVPVGYGLAAPSPFFPILPIVLSPSTILGETLVDLSDTDAPTWPTWTVTGPGSQLTLSNTYDRVQDDGTVTAVTQSLVLNTPIGDGQTVTIDSRPGRQSVTRSDGVSLFSSLGSDPALFPLVDGVNTVRAVLTNAGAASRIAGVADRLYSGAL